MMLCHNYETRQVWRVFLFCFCPEKFLWILIHSILQIVLCWLHLTKQGWNLNFDGDYLMSLFVVTQDVLILAWARERVLIPIPTEV